ncbi:MAG: ribulose-phosphate 3-epimerase [Candidatus Fimenecus sp.]
MIQIAPSILSCDFTKMGEEVRELERCNADLVHLDVMDGHFVPNLTFGAPVVKALRKCTCMPFDVHLMISEPLKYIDDFAKAGANMISFHIESDGDVLETVKAIRFRKMAPAIAIKPKTSAESIFPYIKELSMVLVMTVEPGFGGQKFMEDMMQKVSKIRKEAERQNHKLDIQVDGGISKETIKIAASAGANIFVAGSSVFGSQDRKFEIESLRNIAKENYY